MIARTESARAYCSGSEAAWDQSGHVQGKKWLLTVGACPACNAIAAQFADAVVPLNSAFMPLGSQLSLPDGSVYKIDYTSIYGPPLHPHCLCDLTAVLKDD
jgi:hypothetical protein